ncbi:nuclear transport factor 2 family protein [Actinophytocola sp.]|uniref:nuclear transport factor 2 family protein n=1 Tax=Actinophytocola sp. TaxID=1872138 RepID=UPI0038998B88
MTSPMPARTGRAAVERYYRLVDANRVSELVELFAEDSVYHRPGYRPLVGRAELTAFYTGERVIESGRHVLSAVLTDGPRTAVHGEFTGRLKDGSDVRIRFADFFEVAADGLFSRRETFFFAPAV